MTGSKFILNWHHEAIAEHLEAVYNGDIQFLIINVPPGYSKTCLTVDNFVSWAIAKNNINGIITPKFIHTSYSGDLVNRNSSNVKRIIKSDYYSKIFDGVKIDSKKDALQEWYTLDGGGFYAAPSGGQLTGFHAGRKIDAGFHGAIIIDDPLKPADANSDTEREKINTWFTETLLSRLSYPEKTPIILIMQRLHERDLTGFLLSGESGINFEHLSLPVLDDSRKPRILWEYMHDDKKILKLQANPYVFAGQYQQNPKPEGGGLFKTEHWQRYQEIPPIEHKIITVDLANTEKTRSDYTVCQCWGKYLNRAYLLDQIRYKSEDPAVRIRDFYNKHKPRYVAIESNNMGAGVIRDLKKPFDSQGNKQDAIPIQPVWQSKDKVSRAKDIIPLIISGYVYIPQDAEWISDFIAEHEAFDNGQHDDQVDCTTLAVKKILQDSGVSVYQEFSRAYHVTDVNYNSQYPLIVCYNTINKPAVIFAQLTPNWQLRVLDAIIAGDETRAEFILSAKNKHIMQYSGSSQNYFLLAHKDKQNRFAPDDWTELFLQHYGKSPQEYDITDLESIVESTSKLLADQFFNPITGQRESKFVVNPQADLLIKCLEGGLQSETDTTGQLKPKIKIKEEYPYINIANALHQIVFNFYLSQRIETINAVKKPIRQSVRIV